MGHFRAQGVPMKRKLREFPVTEDALLPVGTLLNVRHFVPGQYVDVTGITKGKGFQVLFSFLHIKYCSLFLNCFLLYCMCIMDLFFICNVWVYVLPYGVGGCMVFCLNECF